MISFSYVFILTLATIIHFNNSRLISTISPEISSSDDGLIPNISSNIHYNHKLNNPDRRIYGGHVTNDFKKYSYMAYLLRVTVTRKNKKKITHTESCGSTLLSPTHALTAAHCLRKCECGHSLDDSNCTKCLFHGVDDFTLFAGSSVPKLSTARSKLKEFYIHPEHKKTDIKHKCIHRYDIAVLELATPLHANKKISIIKLPEPVNLGEDNLQHTMTSRLQDSKTQCIIAGWGTVSSTDQTPFLNEKLKVALVPLIKLDKCINDVYLYKKQYYPNLKKYSSRADVCTVTNICSKAPHFINGICHGDSGGPIICNGVQIGVSSWSLKGCVGPHTPNMYTRVDINVQWIRDIMSGTNITGRYMRIK